MKKSTCAGDTDTATAAILMVPPTGQRWRYEVWEVNGRYREKKKKQET